MVLRRRTPLRRKPIARDKDKKEDKKRPRTGQTRAAAVKELDKWFSYYIRLKHSDGNGYCRCISCGKVYFWKNIQNGHYMSRRYMSTRFCEDNCRPQGVECNIFNQGAIQMYRRALVKEIGEQRVDLVEVRARQERKNWSVFELQQLTNYYKKEVQNLLIEKHLTL